MDVVGLSGEVLLLLLGAGSVLLAVAAVAYAVTVLKRAAWLVVGTRWWQR